MKKLLIIFLILLSASICEAYTISGTLTGTIVEGVTMTLSGSSSATTTTAADGTYSFTVSNGTYKVAPSYAGYVFKPFFISLVVAGTNITTANFASSTITAGITPDIEVRPGTTVKVGQEVYFSAVGSTIPSDATMGCTTGNNCGAKVEYSWDFGDGYACQKGSGIVGQAYYELDCKSTALTHYFMAPGTYTVRLNAQVWDSWQIATGIGVPPAIAAGTVTETITVEGEAPLAGFEIQTAPFNNRTKQYLYIQIPAAYQGNTTQLKVSIIGATSGTTVLLTKSSLTAEEILLFDQTGLAVDTYTLSAQLLNASNEQITGGIWNEYFEKYEASPKVTIDENNSFSINGSLFFPIGPYMTNPTRHSGYWTTLAKINAGHTQDWTETYTPNTWNTYMTTYDLQHMGPGRGNYAIIYGSGNYWQFNHNPTTIESYINTNKSHENMFSWSWQDEPNLGGNGSQGYVNTLAAWAYLGRTNDPDHPTFQLMGGYDWGPYYNTSTKYDYVNSAKFMGGKKWAQDALPWDVYPYAYRWHTLFNIASMGPIAAWISAMELSKTSNKNLMPNIPVIQPGPERAGEITEIRPSDDQNYHLSWLAIIHGAKGIIWFPYFSECTTECLWTSMGKISDQMTVFKDVVLGPTPTKTITRTDKANANLDRVDTLIKENGGRVYVFSARVTEPDYVVGMVDTVRMSNTGNGYKVGELITVTGGTGCRMYIQSVDANGAITSAWRYNFGKNYSVGNDIPTTGGSGTGATVNITKIMNANFTGTEPTTVSPTFTISGLTGTTTLNVYGESRTVTATNGVFTDDYEKNNVHIYYTGASIEGADTTPPTVNSAAVSTNGNNIVFGFSENITATSGAAFTITPSGGAATLTCPSVTSSGSMTCTISRTINYGETITYSYTGTKVTDIATNALAAITNQAVTNNATSQNPPTMELSVTSVGALITSSPSGINCGSTCDYDFTTDSVVTIYGNCLPNYNTPVITGSCASDGTVTMSTNRSCTVTCSKTAPTATIGGAGGTFSGAKATFY